MFLPLRPARSNKVTALTGRWKTAADRASPRRDCANDVLFSATLIYLISGLACKKTSLSNAHASRDLPGLSGQVH